MTSDSAEIKIMNESHQNILGQGVRLVALELPIGELRPTVSTCKSSAAGLQERTRKCRSLHGNHGNVLVTSQLRTFAAFWHEPK